MCGGECAVLRWRRLHNLLAIADVVLKVGNRTLRAGVGPAALHFADACFKSNLFSTAESASQAFVSSIAHEWKALLFPAQPVPAEGGAAGIPSSILYARKAQLQRRHVHLHQRSGANDRGSSEYWEMLGCQALHPQIHAHVSLTWCNQCGEAIPEEEAGFMISDHSVHFLCGLERLCDLSGDCCGSGGGGCGGIAARGERGGGGASSTLSCGR
jgi:hypothetical protein